MVLATVTGTGDAQTGDLPVPLGDLPWIVLQVQAVSPNDPVWGDLNGTLRDDIAAQTPQRSDGCDKALVHSGNQNVHNIRSVRDPEFLAGYTLERVDPGSSDMRDVRPLESLYRSRVEYRVYQGRDSDLRLEPLLRVYMERRLPKHQHTSQRLHTETGLERRGDLYAAIQTARTWIVLG